MSMFFFFLINILRAKQLQILDVHHAAFAPKACLSMLSLVSFADVTSIGSVSELILSWWSWIDVS